MKAEDSIKEDNIRADDNDSLLMTPSERKSIISVASMLAVFIVVIDQILKWVVLEHIIRKGLVDLNMQLVPVKTLGFFEWIIQTPDRLPFYTQDVLPFFNITMVWNKGVSFGLLASDGDMGRNLLIAMALLITGFLSFLITRSQSRFEIFAMAIVIGGAIGNVIDRLRFGAVADFLDIHFWGVHFPVFNIADAAISCGIALLLIYGLFLAPREHNSDIVKQDK